MPCSWLLCSADAAQVRVWRVGWGSSSSGSSSAPLALSVGVVLPPTCEPAPIPGKPAGLPGRVGNSAHVCFEAGSRPGDAQRGQPAGLVTPKGGSQERPDRRACTRWGQPLVQQTRFSHSSHSLGGGRRQHTKVLPEWFVSTLSRYYTRTETQSDAMPQQPQVAAVRAALVQEVPSTRTKTSKGGPCQRCLVARMLTSVPARCLCCDCSSQPGSAANMPGTSWPQSQPLLMGATTDRVAPCAQHSTQHNTQTPAISQDASR